MYRLPDVHPWITEAERAHIASDRPASASAGPAWRPGWLELLRYRQVWAIVAGRFVTDPIWWLYVFWLPQYFQEARGFSLQQVGWSAWFPYLAGGVGALGGGWASGYLIPRGWTVDRARKTVMAVGALLTPAGILAVRAESPYTALALMGVVLLGFQIWVNNLQTLPSDFFPGSAVGSVVRPRRHRRGDRERPLQPGTGPRRRHVRLHAGLRGGGPARSGRPGGDAPAGRPHRARRGPRSRSSHDAVGRRALRCADGARRGRRRSPTFDALLRHQVKLRPELVGVHPRVFVTKDGLEALRARARTTHREEWQRVLAGLAALQAAPPPAPGPQERRSQNVVAFAIAESALAAAVEQKPEYSRPRGSGRSRRSTTSRGATRTTSPTSTSRPATCFTRSAGPTTCCTTTSRPTERARIRASLTRHAGLVYDYFAPGPGKRLNFTQNHDFIPTAGLAVAALALMGESDDAPSWAALARAHHHRAGTLLSPDGYYYEGFEYWIFSTPWLVHFLDAWEHATGESLWDRDVFRNWKLYLAHALLPDGQTRRRLRRHLGGRADAGGRGRRLPARVPGRHAAEQLQRDVPRRRAPLGSRGAGGRGALRVVPALEPRGVLDAALARSAT